MFLIYFTFVQLSNRLPAPVMEEFLFSGEYKPPELVAEFEPLKGASCAGETVASLKI